MRNFFLAASCLAALLSCGKETQKVVIPTPSEKTPTSISISPASLSAPVGGDSYTVTITSPAAPEVSAPPEWVNLTKGTFKNHKMLQSVYERAPVF